ncbi:Uncharacterized protein Fot_03671 [Forsythia ovata]|uniref:Uncharacterized protein n=1 Tax=Forsythia ovata TaxID=205694 RepID=A0ABD1XAW3_9LAMI
MSKRCAPKTNIFGRDSHFLKTRGLVPRTRFGQLQKACVDAQKKAESQLKSCQSMINDKDKELTEALSELANAKGLLAKLGAPSYARALGDNSDVGILYALRGS